MKKILFIVLSLGVLGYGCDKIAKLTVVEEQKPVEAVVLVPRVNSPQLAKLILKPQRTKLDVSKDPFKPLYVETSSTGSSDAVRIGASDIVFLGVIKSDNQYLALLKSNAKKGIYRINDKIASFTIEAIQNDKVILNDGIQTITLKRGTIN